MRASDCRTSSTIAHIERYATRGREAFEDDPRHSVGLDGDVERGVQGRDRRGQVFSESRDRHLRPKPRALDRVADRRRLAAAPDEGDVGPQTPRGQACRGLDHDAMAFHDAKPADHSEERRIRRCPEPPAKI